jgi:hypothetical protein
VSVVSQRFSCVPDVGGRAACENNDVSLAVRICARGLPSQLDLRPSKLLTCRDTTRRGWNEGVRDLLQLHEFSHHVQTPGSEAGPRSLVLAATRWGADVKQSLALHRA